MIDYTYLWQREIIACIFPTRFLLAVSTLNYILNLMFWYLPSDCVSKLL